MDFRKDSTIKFAKKFTNRGELYSSNEDLKSLDRSKSQEVK